MRTNSSRRRSFKPCIGEDSDVAVDAVVTLESEQLKKVLLERGMCSNFSKSVDIITQISCRGT